MPVLRPIQPTAAIAKVHMRRRKLLRRFNKRKLNKYLEMYASYATHRDPHLSLIDGINNIREYFIEHFNFMKDMGSPQMQLKSKRILQRGEFIYDVGEYWWSTIRKGRYSHIWTWINDDYYLVSDRFTIYKVRPSLKRMNDENAVSDENNDTGA